MSTEVKAISVWAVLIITPLCFQWWITALVVASAAIVHFTLWAMAEEKSECAYPHFHHRDIPAMVSTPLIVLLVFYACIFFIYVGISLIWFFYNEPEWLIALLIAVVTYVVGAYLSDKYA
jgi:hypothetical protein